MIMKYDFSKRVGKYNNKSINDFLENRILEFNMSDADEWRSLIRTELMNRMLCQEKN